jgi:hypothetical protein
MDDIGNGDRISVHMLPVRLLLLRQKKRGNGKASSQFGCYFTVILVPLLILFMLLFQGGKFISMKDGTTGITDHHGQDGDDGYNDQNESCASFATEN